jgi:hypothetical protein
MGTSSMNGDQFWEITHIVFVNPLFNHSSPIPNFHTPNIELEFVYLGFRSHFTTLKLLL